MTGHREPTVSSQDRQRVIVLYGGQSPEHEVSRVTAAHVLAAIDRSRYDVAAVAVGRDGVWRTPRSLPAPDELDALPTEGQAAAPAQVLARSDAPGQLVVIPLIHGPMGEDGTLQGLLELAGVPYVGAGVLGSALAMDKAMAKSVCAAAAIPQARWTELHEPEFEATPSSLGRLVDDLGPTVFVKPANMGSSVGVSRATGPDELESALEVAFAFDQRVVVEEAISGREIEIAALGNVELSFSVPGEIIPAAEFYDYDDKYTDGAAKLIVPAELSRREVVEVTTLAERACRALRVEGMARVDFLYEDAGRGFLLNEINTIPGFTPISMYPRLWEASGLSYPSLIDALIELAIEAHRRKARKRVR